MICGWTCFIRGVNTIPQTIPVNNHLGGPFASSQSYMYHCPTMNPQLEMVDSWDYHITSFGGHGCEYLPHGRVEQIRFSNYSSPPARWGLLDFIRAVLLLLRLRIPSPPPPPPRSPDPSGHSTAGPPPRAPDPSGHCRTSTARRMAERIHWWTERWLELCFLECVQWLQWSPHPQLLDVVWCSAVVVVVVV